MEISTPGRICLFGEHLDYLGLPVIAMAISLRMSIKGTFRSDNMIKVDMPDLNEMKVFCLDELNSKNKDYFKSGLKICKKAGLNFSRGMNCQIKSDIPISAGTSSSSAMNVGWINFLSKMADKPFKLNPNQIAEMAYQAEVEEFNESGGMMDQYSTAVGQIIYLKPSPSIKLEKLDVSLGTFVLGDSCEPKSTQEVLMKCKDIQKQVLKKVKEQNNDFSLLKNKQALDLTSLNRKEKNIFECVTSNINILNQAHREMKRKEPKRELIGKLLLKHHYNLKSALEISTPKIELMLDAAMNVGALGGKINGSGGGGCMFAYAPDNPEKVADAIRNVGGKAYIVKADNGTKQIKG